jgi:hypothetical protein
MRRTMIIATGCAALFAVVLTLFRAMQRRY